jgi:hypothetical protein
LCTSEQRTPGDFADDSQHGEKGEYAVTPTDRSRLRVPKEYLPLYHYLEHRYASLVVLSFEQIESLLGFTLPQAAITDRAWWTRDSAIDPQTETWRVTGRLATPNLLARNVAFERLA